MTSHAAATTEVVVGVDGCRGGWIAAELHRSDHRLALRTFTTFADLPLHYPEPVVIGIDVPIGLKEYGSRDCDLAARKLLGVPKGSSVFPAPIRGILGCATWMEANERSKALHGKGISQQTVGILPKITEVDAVMCADRSLQERVIEVHPEVSFREIAGGEAVRSSKKRLKGFEERRTLLLAALPGISIPATRPEVKALAGAPADDVLDAIAAAWTACRFATKRSVSIPDTARIDTQGLPMAITY